MLSAIDPKLKDSPIKRKRQNSKGRKDNHIGPLDRWATPQCIMQSSGKREVGNRSGDPARFFTHQRKVWKTKYGGSKQKSPSTSRAKSEPSSIGTNIFSRIYLKNIEHSLYSIPLMASLEQDIYG